MHFQGEIVPRSNLGLPRRGIAVEAQQYSFRYYRTKEGLTKLAVKVVFQDRTGFLWAGTENGLFRYDGQRLERYGPAEGLPRDVVLSLGEAPDSFPKHSCRTTHAMTPDRTRPDILPRAGNEEEQPIGSAGKRRECIHGLRDTQAPQLDVCFLGLSYDEARQPGYLDQGSGPLSSPEVNAPGAR